MNEPFLAQVARYYYSTYGSAISQLRFVFPSKRALTFFRHHLGLIASERPIFAPRMQTIGDLLAELTPSVKLLDKTALLFELYEAYREVRSEQGASVETFDSFLYWGGLILKDFDSCDRYLVPTHHLYSNLRDLKELSDDFSYLSEESRLLIQSFWGNIPALATMSEEERASHKAYFLSFWESLHPLYERFNERLLARGLTYEGHLYRLASEAREQILDQLPEEGEIVFVGLFQLTPAERRVFRTLHQAGRSAFCWDSAVVVVQDEGHPASAYYRQLVSEFGQVDGPWAHASASACLPEQIQVIQAPSLLAQVKGLPHLFQELGIATQAAELQAALVLPDEKLLLPTASAIPEEIGAVNITLGYPLDRTPIALLLKRWIALLELGQRRSQGLRYPADQLLGLLGHRLITEHSPEAAEAMRFIRSQKRFYLPLASLWEAVDDPFLHLLLDPVPRGEALLDRLEGLLRHFLQLLPQETDSEEAGEEADEGEEGEGEAPALPSLSSFDIEFIHHYLRLVTRLRGLVTPYLEHLELASVVQLLDGLVGTVTIPFEGDPLEGLQVMGLLETRGLHFDTMVYLAAQEGSLPSTRYTDTLIPFTLRRAFGLPVGGEDDLGADYTFFQSIARARQLVFIVAPAGEATALGEESRYISLLAYIYGRPIARKTLRLKSELTPPPLRSVPKEGPLWEAFVAQSQRDPRDREQPGVMISPSKLSKFIACPLRFYYEVVCKLQEEQEPSILIGSDELGTIVHAILEGIYNELIDLPHQSQQEQQNLSTGRQITPEMLQQLLRPQGKISRLVEQAYRHEMKPSAGKLSNLSQIYCQTIEAYVRAILEADLRYAPFYYIRSEEKLSMPFPLSDGRQVYIGGIIDRLDSKEIVGEDGLREQRYRIVDYKTGDAKLSATRWELLQKPDYKAILQTLLYAEIYQRLVLDGQGIAAPLYPAIYRLTGTDGLLQQPEKYDPLIKLPKEDSTESSNRGSSALRSYQEVAPFFQPFFTTEVLDKLFDEEIPFEQTAEESHCRFCPFTLSCGR